MVRTLFAFPHRFAILAAALVLLLTVPIYQKGGESPAQLPAATTAPTGSPANASTETVDENGNRVTCSSLPGAQNGVLLTRIIPCLLYTIEHSTERFSAAMIEWLMPVIWSFITLVIVIFGLKVLQGEGQLQAQTLVLLIKLGFVLTVLQLIPGTLVPLSYGILEEGQMVVAGTLDGASDNIKCDMSRYGGSGTSALWAHMDCLLGKLYGFTTGTDSATGESRPNMLMASSIFGLLGGFFFGGSFGVALFFVCVGVLWSLFRLVMRVVMAFLNAYLIVSLHMIIAPLFLPLVLLRVTSNYFEKWWSAILAAFLMPVLITSYVMVALQLYDKLLFSDDSLLNKMLSNNLIAEAQALPKKACNFEMTNDPKDRSTWLGKDEAEIYKNPFMKNFVNPLLSGGNDLCAGLYKTNLDLQRLQGDDAAFASKKKAFTELFMDAVKLLFMAWLIDAGFSSLIAAIRPMIGSGSVVASLDMTTPAEQRFNMGMNSARSRFQSAFAGTEDGNTGTASGTEFLRRIPGATKNAANGFLSGISRDR